MAKKQNELLYIKILSLIAEDISQPRICQLLKISRQNFNFYKKQLIFKGLISSQDGGFISLNTITEEGKTYLVKASCKSINRDSSVTFTGAGQIPQIEYGHFDNIHQLSFLFNIRREAALWMPNETQLNNDVKKNFDRFGDIGITIFKGRGDKAVSLQMQLRILARDPHEATWRAYQKVMGFAQYLMESVGFDLGYPVLNRKPHYTIKGDPAVDEISKRMLIHTDRGHIDRSHDTGEMEYYTPDRAKRYIEMPDTLEELKTKVDAGLSIDRELIDAINSLTDSNTALKEAIRGSIGAMGSPAAQQPQRAPDAPQEQQKEDVYGPPMYS
jgi:hypothetical protein